MSIPLSFVPPYIGGGDPYEFWQPTGVAGFVLDLNPKFKLTQDSSLATISVAAVANNAPSTSDAFSNSNKSLQPLYQDKGWVGSRYTRPAMLFDGLNDYLLCTTGIGSTLAGGDDTAFTVFVVGQHVTLSALFDVIFGMFRTTNTNPIFDLYAHTGQYWSNKRGDTGLSLAIPGGTADTAKHVFEVTHTGTVVELRVDGVLIFSAAQDTVPVTIDCMALGATYGNASPANFANLLFGRLLGFTGALALGTRDTIRSVLTQAYL